MNNQNEIESKFMNAIFSAMNEYYSGHISILTKRALMEKKQREIGTQKPASTVVQVMNSQKKYIPFAVEFERISTHKPLRCKALSSNINKRYGAKK